MKIIKYAAIVIVIAILVLTVYSYVVYFNNDSPIIPEKIKPPLEYEELINELSSKYRVPIYTIYATIRAESSFDETAKSSAGAMGLMQIMPKTYEWLCSITGDEYKVEDLYIPEINIRYGTMYLARLYRVYEDWDLVHTAYNAGPGQVKKWLSDERYCTNGVLTYIPIKETRDYVKKINKYKKQYKEYYVSLNWDDYAETVEVINETTEDINE